MLLLLLAALCLTFSPLPVVSARRLTSGEQGARKQQASGTALAAAAAAGVHAEPPWFCHDLDCPRFSVVETYASGTIELRAYEASEWDRGGHRHVRAAGVGGGDSGWREGWVGGYVPV